MEGEKESATTTTTEDQPSNDLYANRSVFDFHLFEIPEIETEDEERSVSMETINDSFHKFLLPTNNIEGILTYFDKQLDFFENQSNSKA